MEKEEHAQPTPTFQQEFTPLMPSRKAQSWGTIISIIVIMLMVIIGALYAWGERIASDDESSVPAIDQ